MNIIENVLEPVNKTDKPIAYDINYVADGNQKPVVLFLHGFQGFKNWGHFDLIADRIAREGFVFVKMNFSHNGTSIDNQEAYVDLEAFGMNNHGLELDDAGRMIDFIHSEAFDLPDSEVDVNRLILIGHSRGGGVAILKTNEDPRVTRLVTWASINDHNQRWPTSDLETWRNKGVHYVRNERTNTELPMYYQIVENYNQNKKRLDIPDAISCMKVPHLAIHGGMDEVVPKTVLEEFKVLNKNTKTKILAKNTHTFGGQHPYPLEPLGRMAQDLLDATIPFLREALITK